MNYFENQSDHMPLTQEMINDLMGKPFTGEYDDNDEPIFSTYQVDEIVYQFMLLTRNGDQQTYKMIPITDTYIDNLDDTHDYIELKQSLFPVFERKPK